MICFLLVNPKYDVRLCPYLLDCTNPTLANYLMPDNTTRRRFLVVDQTVQKLYGNAIKYYFESNKVHLIHTVVIPGEEANKRMKAVQKRPDL